MRRPREDMLGEINYLVDVACRTTRCGRARRLWTLFGIDPRGRDELGEPVADPDDPLGGMDLPVVHAAQHDQVGQRGLAAVLPRRQVMHLAPGNRATAAGVGTAAVSGGHRPAEPVGDGAGGPADVERLALAVHHDRHHGRVAAQHPQRLRGDRAAEVQAGGAGPVLQVLQPDQHVHVRAVPAALGDVAVVEDVAAHVGQRLGLPLARRLRSSSAVSGLACASITVAIASNIAGVVEPTA